MVMSKAATVNEYLAQLPPARREAIAKVRDVILKNLPDGYEEGMLYGMIGYYVPFSILPDTYNNLPLGYVALASQKNNMALYLNVLYMDRKIYNWFFDAYANSGKRVDMGKSCVRFRKIEDLPLDLVGQVVAKTPPEELVRLYHASRS